jgi:hypothetical protein
VPAQVCKEKVNFSREEVLLSLGERGLNPSIQKVEWNKEFSMSLEAIKEQLEKHVDELGEQAMAGPPAHAGFFAITAFSVSYGGMVQAF